MKCYLCQQSGDVRPYGENGQLICFPCMIADPQRQQTAERMLSQQLDAACAQSNVVVIGGEAGPAPMGGYRH